MFSLGSLTSLTRDIIKKEGKIKRDGTFSTNIKLTANNILLTYLGKLQAGLAIMWLEWRVSMLYFLNVFAIHGLNEPAEVCTKTYYFSMLVWLFWIVVVSSYGNNNTNWRMQHGVHLLLWKYYALISADKNFGWRWLVRITTFESIVNFLQTSWVKNPEGLNTNQMVNYSLSSDHPSSHYLRSTYYSLIIRESDCRKKIIECILPCHSVHLCQLESLMQSYQIRNAKRLGNVYSSVVNFCTNVWRVCMCTSIRCRNTKVVRGYCLCITISVHTFNWSNSVVQRVLFCEKHCYLFSFRKMCFKIYLMLFAFTATADFLCMFSLLTHLLYCWESLKDSNNAL